MPPGSLNVQVIADLRYRLTCHPLSSRLRLS
jgi:hypothetical protein